MLRHSTLDLGQLQLRNLCNALDAHQLNGEPLRMLADVLHVTAQRAAVERFASTPEAADFGDYLECAIGALERQERRDAA